MEVMNLRSSFSICGHTDRYLLLGAQNVCVCVCLSVCLSVMTIFTISVKTFYTLSLAANKI
jgi:hypothetical protein